MTTSAEDLALAALVAWYESGRFLLDRPTLNGGPAPAQPSATRSNAPAPTCPLHGERLSGGDQCWTCFGTPGVQS